MASGTFNFNLLSRDYPYNAATDTPRGHFSYSFSFNWSTNGSQLTLSTANIPMITWGVCSNAGFALRVMFHPHGGWPQILAEAQTGAVTCSGLTPSQRPWNVTYQIQDLFAAIPHTYNLPSGGELWLEYGMLNQPAPTPNLPNAMPYITWTQKDQVPVEIPDPDYRPGSRMLAGVEYSCNRPTGANERRSAGVNWELRTMDGGWGTGNPPERRIGGVNRNQSKVGIE